MNKYLEAFKEGTGMNLVLLGGVVTLDAIFEMLGTDFTHLTDSYDDAVGGSLQVLTGVIVSQVGKALIK